MTEKLISQYESDSAETLFHDMATPLLIAKMKAKLLADHLPNIIKSLTESPQLQHLLPPDPKIIEALLAAPEIMASNLDVVQKKLNMLSESVLLQTSNGTVSHFDDFGVTGEGGDDAATASASVKLTGIKTVLLVDDEQIHRDIGANLLSPRYQVDFASNGLEAIEKCEQKDYDLILMDLHMPRMNGEQATLALRARVSKETIIIGLTSLPLGANQSGLRAKGFTDFLEKPLTLKELQRVLRTYSQTA